tara:strand:- start:1968 stop:2177 length:210 start_codon:yes stop_codon:yes gene_type:complete
MKKQTYFEYLFRNPTTRFFTLAITLITLGVPISEYFRGGSVMWGLVITVPVFVGYFVGHFLDYRKYKRR